MQTITLQIPDNMYFRLQQAARATKQPFENIILRAVRIGSPPDWEDVPAEFQADIAALDRLDDKSLWHVVRKKFTDYEMSDYQQQLEKNADGTISEDDSEKLKALRNKADCMMLCKAQAAAILRWRGHSIPPSEKL